ncbi:MAG: M48 family peptidase [Betaproteobacteria bacterium]|nr:M48 family peptidase [Betaproteobacteria bacterium]
MKLRVMALLCLALAGGGCASVQTTQGGVVGIERQQSFSILLSAEQMDQGAGQAYQKIIAEARAKGTLDRDPAQTQRVQRIAARIIQVTNAFRTDAPSWKWEVHVLTSDQINAWCMPGGKIALYSGIIEKLQLTDDEIAAIMGHEIAHALREHGRERASSAVNQAIAVRIIGGLLGVGDVGQTLADKVLTATIGSRNSREQETESDRIGVELAARAGFHSRAAVQLWQKMAKAGGAGGPVWLSTHPAAETRIRDLEAYSVKVMALYEQARGSHPR